MVFCCCGACGGSVSESFGLLGRLEVAVVFASGVASGLESLCVPFLFRELLGVCEGVVAGFEAAVLAVVVSAASLAAERVILGDMRTRS